MIANICFISARENLGYILCPSDFIPEMQIPNFEEKKDISYEQVLSLADLGYKNATTSYDDGVCISTQKTTTSYNYSCGYMVKDLGNEKLIIYGVDDSVNADSKQILKCRLEKALAKDYLKIYKEHKRHSRNYASKSYINIDDEQEISNLWALGDYFFGCCSKNNGNPIALQGVWTADNGELPPWRGDYHFDLNVQMSYWSYIIYF